MKNWKLFISVLLITSFLLASCASTSTSSTTKSKEVSQVESEIITEIAEPEPTAEELFLESLSGIKIEFTKIPAKTKKNKAFSSAYELTVSDKDGNPVSGFEVALIVPVKDLNNNITGKRESLITDENGVASYMPQTPDFADKTKVVAYPFVPDNLDIKNEDIEPYKVYADFLSESDIVAKGAIMFVYEYTERGKPSKTSYEILSALRKKGVTQIGNAPISDDTSYITASKQKIYKDNYEYVEDQFGYLIGGTIKFADSVEANEDGTYTAHLVADIYGIEMKNGNVIYEKVFENTGSGSNWNKAVDSCKQELISQIVDSLMFGL